MPNKITVLIEGIKQLVHKIFPLFSKGAARNSSSYLCQTFAFNLKISIKYAVK